MEAKKDNIYKILTKYQTAMNDNTKQKVDRSKFYYSDKKEDERKRSLNNDVKCYKYETHEFGKDELEKAQEFAKKHKGTIARLYDNSKRQEFRVLEGYIVQIEITDKTKGLKIPEFRVKQLKQYLRGK